MSLAGLQLGRYHLLHSLGKSKMSEVYLAEDARIEQQVAIKVLHREVTPHFNEHTIREAVSLFQREAMSIARLDHPHILSLYDYGEISLDRSLLLYLVMPLRPEGSLSKWLKQRYNSTGLPPQAVAHFVRQAASALQHAHDHQIIHQDVKPLNFLLRTNEENPELPDLLLADFGIAKFMAATTLTSQTISGTPAYMAPEQWGGDAEPATDQYALAVMAYQMLTGRLPFLGDQQQMMYQHFHSEPARLSNLNPDIPTGLDEVVLRALAKQPEDRFPTITAFAQAFQQAVQNIDTRTPPSDSNALIPQRDFPFRPAIQLRATIDRPRRSSRIHHFPRVQRFSRIQKVLLVVLALLSIFVSIELLLLGRLYLIGGENSIATTTPLAVSALVNPYTHTGTLIINDPLSDNGQGYSWQEGKNGSGAACEFRGGAYHAIQAQKGDFHACFAQSTNFSNFVYEVQITISTGDFGGIIFCADRINSTFYYFRIGRDGRFYISRSVDGVPTHAMVLFQGIANFIHTNLNQVNLLAVVVKNGSIVLFVNRREIGRVNDSAYTHGQIGVFASNTSNSSDVKFQNVKVWKL